MKFARITWQGAPYRRVDVGWTAGAHVLDVDFQPAKNIINEALCFDLCVEVDKLPADKLKAYYEVNLKALAAENPTGLPTAKQKREAKEAARDQLETEAKDGRYKKRKCIPVMWDAASNEVLFGVTSSTHVDRLVSLFQQTFGYGLDPITAGKRAFQLAELNRMPRTVDESAPSKFGPGSCDNVAWIPDDTSRDSSATNFCCGCGSPKIRSRSWTFSEQERDGNESLLCSFSGDRPQ